ncbi:MULTISPECIES: maleate cis-trans isomerase family protein [Amycolatopsis]|uniref:Asp/Glu racemase n=1 Tax=Amycolatopsis albidoflavus TaxID=102226 RepID=A0ABW5HYI9_9PSEU
MQPGETRLGLIVPSSNTNAEPLTAAMLAGTRATAFASRFPLPADLDAVIDASLVGPAADLLAEAGISAIAFHGTSGSWLGLDHDRALAAGLAERTGAAATTASLALVAAVEALGVKKVGLVFPGPSSIADTIASEYGAAGIEVVSRSVPSRPMTNPEISGLPFSEISALVSAAASDAAEAIVCVGTNLRAAYLVPELESRLGVPIVDSAAATVWQLLALAGVSEQPQGWGRLFETDSRQ